MFKKILVCLDGSKLAEQILPYAIEQAKCFGSKIVLLKVIHEHLLISPDIPGAPGVPVQFPVGDTVKKEESESAQYLEEMALRLSKEHGIKAEVVLTMGPPGETIVRYAEENKVGMIAIATHGRGGFGRAVFGSVADYVLRESGIPVFVIKPKSVGK